MAFDPLTLQCPIASSPFMEQIFERLAYAPAQREICRRYAEDGYLIIEPDIADVAAIAKHMANSLEESFKTQDRIIDAWRFDPDVRNLAILPKVYEILETLYGRKPAPFQTLNFKIGTEQATHSDTIHFNSIPEDFMCGVWIALEDIDENNGPLHYYTGSHRLPRYDFASLGIAASLNRERMKQELGQRLPELIQQIAVAKNLPKELGLVKQGQAVIWSANMYHGGEPIRDKSRTRYSQATHYYFENCTYYTPYFSDPFLGNIFFRQITDIETNQPVRNTYCGRDDINYINPDLPVLPARKQVNLTTKIKRFFKQRALGVSRQTP